MGLEWERKHTRINSAEVCVNNTNISNRKKLSWLQKIPSNNLCKEKEKEI